MSKSTEAKSSQEWDRCIENCTSWPNGSVWVCLLAPARRAPDLSRHNPNSDTELKFGFCLRSRAYLTRHPLTPRTALVKTGYGLVAGLVVSFVLFRSPVARSAVTSFAGGAGFGISYKECQDRCVRGARVSEGCFTRDLSVCAVAIRRAGCCARAQPPQGIVGVLALTSVAPPPSSSLSSPFFCAA